MLYLLITAAVVLFVLHVAFLLASFRRTGFSGRRYFISHLTLWLTGLVVFALAWLYSGHQVSSFLDYFSTPGRLFAILGFTAGLSLVAHLIVRFAVLPVWQKN